MTYSRSLTLTCTLLAGAAVALSQTPPAAPAPPAPPPQVAAPAPAAAPAPSPRALRLDDLDDNLRLEVEAQIDAARGQLEKLRDFDFDSNVKLNLEIAQEQLKNRFEFDRAAIEEQVEAAREQIKALEPDLAYAKSLGVGFGAGAGKGFAFAPQIAPMPPMPPTPPPAARVRVNYASADRNYSNGQRALDDRHWDEAVQDFNQVISRGSTRVDGALYWKAYALAKLGRRDESLGAIAELRKSYGSSKWMDDAKALEIEVNQAAGKPISPEAENDEDLKLLALEALSHSDPERAFPALEKIIKGSSSPKLKRNALYVLANNNSPKAQAMLEQIARGGANPDLQAKAITYMPRNANSGQILSEIYSSSNDTEVKRAVLNALLSSRDKDRVLAIARNEKNNELRGIAIGYLGNVNGNSELWQLYQSETTTEGKEQILNHMYNNGNPDKLMELLRTEKDPKLRVTIARVLSSYRNTQVSDSLIAMYANETDPQVKQAIIDNIYSQRNGKAMVDLAKSEKDPKLKLRLIERLGNMKNCKECADYLVEILNK
ncbi:MAG TPA: hypothetical protein VMJ75_30930 [Candidatus Acidoferrales bacterium]|nr:hypothetical protein [Candidatus Acidoferrales bacterium]